MIYFIRKMCVLAVERKRRLKMEDQRILVTEHRSEDPKENPQRFGGITEGGTYCKFGIGEPQSMAIKYIVGELQQGRTPLVQYSSRSGKVLVLEDAPLGLDY